MNEATVQYVLAHADDDVRQLALQGCKDTQVDMTLALQQIEGRQKARQKLPSWAANDGIVYPTRLSMEQCSSENTARYKARIIDDLIINESCQDGKCKSRKRKLVDLTGGFGVDFAFMAPLFGEAVYIEQQQELCALASHNFGVLGLQHAKVVCGNATDYLQQMERASLVFIDPARRDSHGARTFGISDCTPNVLPLIDELLSKADHVMLKLSPMLDWQKAVADVGAARVEQVHIVAADNECKELLLLLSAKGSQQPMLYCISLSSKPSPIERGVVSFPIGKPVERSICSPLLGRWVGGEASFLYEPNTAMMKAGLFTEVAERYGVRQVSANSHLFTSEQMVDGFPGRTFSIVDVCTMNKHDLKRHITPLRQANITVRNFPLSAQQLRQRLKLSEGGSNYLFATTLANGQHVLIVARKTETT